MSGNMFDKKSPMMPFFISALVYPGAGQMMSGRFISGLIMMTVFSIAFLVLVYLGVTGCIAYFREQVVGGGAAPPVDLAVYLKNSIIPFIVTVFVYFWSAIDALLLGRKAKAEAAPDLNAMAEAEIAGALNNPKPGSPMSGRGGLSAEAAEKDAPSGDPSEGA